MPVTEVSGVGLQDKAQEGFYIVQTLLAFVTFSSGSGLKLGLAFVNSVSQSAIEVFFCHLKASVVLEIERTNKEARWVCIVKGSLTPHDRVQRPRPRGLGQQLLLRAIYNHTPWRIFRVPLFPSMACRLVLLPSTGPLATTNSPTMSQPTNMSIPAGSSPRLVHNLAVPGNQARGPLSCFLPFKEPVFHPEGPVLADIGDRGNECPPADSNNGERLPDDHRTVSAFLGSL